MLREIMTRFPETVAPSDTLIYARDRMVWGSLRHLPVLDGARLVGVLSDRDITRHQARTGESLFSSPGDTVDMAMTSPVSTASPDDSLVEAMARMAADKIGCLPLTETGKLVGLVTVTDVLVAQVRAHTEMPPVAEGPSVADVMSRDPQIVRADEPLIEAAARMHQHQIRHLPVVDDDNRVIGMLSDRDVRSAIGDPSRPRGGLSGDLRVSSGMTAPALTVEPTQTAGDIGKMFAGLGAGAFPVVDGDRKLVGMISYVDVLRALIR